jgi:phosphoglycerate dehydrogenase-like enzyme
VTRLLIYEPSFRRIEAELSAHDDHLIPVLLGRDGKLSVQRASVSMAEARADCAWFNAEVFESGVSRDFAMAALASPALKWVQSAAAGFDHPIFAQIVGKGARLTTSHGQAIGIADYVLAGVLDHFQRGPERRAAQNERAWRELSFREMLDTTWLVIGFGAIGQAVAQRARAFGGHIVGVRRAPGSHPLADAMATLDQVAQHLPGADVVVLSAPLSPATRHMADSAFFAAMKPGSVLVNVGRGALVDEPAMLEALERDAPAHAVLDVFETEPLPADSLFWSHPKVSLTAHAAGVTGGQDLRNQALFLDNLARYLRGDALLNEIDPKDVLDR